MSKVSSTAQIGGSNKPTMKQKNPLRGSYGKLTLDLKNLKSDLKNIVPGTTVAYDKHSQSPKLPMEKTSHPHAKSPRTKYNPSKLTIETSDHKDALSVEKKIYPQTTKAQHTPSISSSNFDKFKKPSHLNEKGDGSKAKESQIKEMLSSYENVFGKKGAEGKDSSKIEANSKYSNKTKIMEEPPKKASMPNTLSLTLNNIYTNTGSSSHRAPLNSPPSDRTNINNAQAIYASLNRKNSQKSDVDLEQQVANLVMNSQHLPQQNLNNLLVDLASISSEHMKGGVSKININSINNINTINNNLGTGERLPSPKESNNSASQYNDLLRVLNDKNKEIQKLSQDKVELRSTLDVLTSEITNLKKMKILVKEKEKAIENLQHSLTDAIKESEDLKRDMLNGSQDGGGPHIGQHHFAVRKGNNPSIGDIEGIKALINQLKGITDSSGEVANDSLEQKTHLLETITKENHHSKLKKSDLSYNSFNLESRIERGSQSKEVMPDLYNRNFSETLEVPFGKKTNESPYYDALKTTKKNMKANTGAKKGSIGSKKLISESQTIKPSTANTGNSKKGDSLLGTPRKPQLHTELAERQYKIQPNTTTGGTDIDLFKRKLSHDPKLISDTLTDNLNKKKLQVDKKSTGQRMPSAGNHSHKESIDIGKALSGLKDRIGMLLSKHRDDQKKLKSTHDVYLKKLDTLINH